MKNPKNPEWLLEAALAGLEEQRKAIEAKIAFVRTQLGKPVSKPKASTKTTGRTIDPNIKAARSFKKALAKVKGPNFKSERIRLVQEFLASPAAASKNKNVKKALGRARMTLAHLTKAAPEAKLKLVDKAA